MHHNLQHLTIHPTPQPLSLIALSQHASTYRVVAPPAHRRKSIAHGSAFLIGCPRYSAKPPEVIFPTGSDQNNLRRGAGLLSPQHPPASPNQPPEAVITHPSSPYFAPSSSEFLIMPHPTHFYIIQCTCRTLMTFWRMLVSGSIEPCSGFYATVTA